MRRQPIAILPLILIAVALGLGAVPPMARAGSTSEDVAYGTGSVLTTLVYAPVKASVCILGGITGGFTLPFAGPRTAEKVVSSACGGTWTITPGTLRGREPIRFVGGGEDRPVGRAATRR